jgi:hypothetical protein
MEQKNLPLTKQEADALASIINVAIKSAGLEGNIAKNGTYFFEKLNDLFAPKKEKFTEQVKKGVAKENLAKKK